jgi:Phosphopantetheine attachment site
LVEPNHSHATETEGKMLEIWKCVFDAPSIELDDDFLELGGESLFALMCISRVRSTFQCNLGIEEFFMEGATIRRFAAVVDTAHANRRGTQSALYDRDTA